MAHFERLFEPGRIGTLDLANRIIVAPMVTHYSKDGYVTDKMIRYYAERARGGAGLVVLEAAYPRKGVNPGRIHIWDDSFVPGLKRLTDSLHQWGGKVAIQINPSRGRSDAADPVSASTVPHPRTGKVPRALTPAEIRGLVEDFGRGVLRAREAGFDAVMIHGASGYLISEFLSPRANRRNDAYGGDIAGRSRFLVEIALEAKRQGGKDLALILRLAASERVEGGLSLEDAVETCRLARQAGVDAVDVVSGVADSMEWVVPAHNFPPACNAALAAEIKQRAGLPISVAGKIVDPAVAEEVLRSGHTDFISLGRALLADPYFPAKVKAGKVSDITTCTCCMSCMESFYAAEPLICAVNPALGEESDATR